ncbi:MAG: LytTR family DNA-binding domain-containing protein [Cellulosilyticaceae bacterium]
MKIQLCCSEDVKERLNKLAVSKGIIVEESSSIALVEKGYDLPEDKICVVFNTLDFREAFELIQEDNSPSEQCNKGEEIEISTKDVIVGYYQDRYALIKPREIMFIEANKNEITCVTSEKTYYLKQPLYIYERLLKEKGIIQINKSQLVNMVNVIEIIPWFNSRLVLLLKNNSKLEVSKKYSQMLRKAFDI